MKLSAVSEFLASAMLLLFLIAPTLWDTDGEIFFWLSLAAQAARILFAKLRSNIRWAGTLQLALILAWFYLLRGAFTPILNALVVLVLMLIVVGIVWKRRSFKAIEQAEEAEGDAGS